MAIKHIKVVDDLTVEQAEKLRGTTYEILLCRKPLTEEVKRILTETKITHYYNLTEDRINAILDNSKDIEKTYMLFELIGNVVKRQVDDKSGLRNSFMADDIFRIVDDEEIFEIETVYVSPAYRKKGIGSMMVRQAIEQHNDKIICCATASLTRDFPEEPTSEQSAKHLNGLHEFFTKLGFQTINDLVDYQSREAMIYMNDKGRALRQKITEHLERWKEEHKEN